MSPQRHQSEATLRAALAKTFAAPFVTGLGIVLIDVAPGTCTTEKLVTAGDLQQHGAVHAGVISTIADHTAGGAVCTRLAEDLGVVTIALDVRFIRAAVADKVRCEAEAIRVGSSVAFAEATVKAIRDHEERLVARASVTLAVVSWDDMAARIRR
ncbi:MAG TPA: PaaI family thioesterase [Kofleriaceae bacterium]|nr:PaaI family thioesterase [Kofleriaceae bacterium]